MYHSGASLVGNNKHMENLIQRYSFFNISFCNPCFIVTQWQPEVGAGLRLHAKCSFTSLNTYPWPILWWCWLWLPDNQRLIGDAKTGLSGKYTFVCMNDDSMCCGNVGQTVKLSGVLSGILTNGISLWGLGWSWDIEMWCQSLCLVTADAFVFT